MHVIHLSVECFPLAKVGGLADVVGALPRYQRKSGVDAWVVSPFYDKPFTKDRKFQLIHAGTFVQGGETLAYEVLKEKKDPLGFPLYLIRIPGKLDREEVYCYPDEAEQWIAFQHAFLRWVTDAGIIPDVVNCHDHHVGLIPFLMKHAVDFNQLADVKTLFTIHNGQYQGWMTWDKGALLPAFDTWKWGLLDWDGLINPFAAAVKCCDAFSTVSEGYLQELFVQANGLEGLFQTEAYKGVGIVNGIDDEYWNPELDNQISKTYKKSSVKSGKKSNKKAFCDAVGLNSNLPLLAFIGRFAQEKGADLLPAIISNIFSRLEDKICIFILGSGDEAVETTLKELQDQYPRRLATFIGYNEQLAHQVYASADLLLMPSRVEPCGLNQLYALKYGTIPIVHAVGGLKDTVIDLEEQGGYGFLFAAAEPEAAVESVARAVNTLTDASMLQKVRQKAMSLDFSWDKSANKYIQLYDQL
ncbi:glycogen synthase [Sphingobacterium deserti]|uniref:Glycogen synthase n=1 Tax=Sphingobacterium deserti TaxID=1229276 RepID=A0A0B8TBB4_9SPHI|nr:glycogen/starch synthase [Sphingobacterium deserti]KGE16159.1 glycogen/starch synthase, ADP-glucose type [Sphingobacterium deserti]